MAYTRQNDNLQFVINNFNDDEEEYNPNFDYSMKSQRSNDPLYPKVDPLSHPSEYKDAHSPHYRFLPTGMPAQSASLLVFPFSEDKC